MHNYVIYNGINSENLGLNIEYIPHQNRPARKVDVYSVPGRNGDIIVPQDAWENVEQSYSVWGGANARNSATETGYKIANWLFSSFAYERLEDSYDTTHYRKAAFIGSFDFESVFTRYGRAELTFTCDPRRFLLTGETSVTLTGTGTITNPTPFTARPVIVVHGTGSATIECGGKTLTIAGIVDGMTLDCELQDAYNGATNLNSLVSGYYPVINGGEQTITVTGGITSIEVTPNWWEL